MLYWGKIRFSLIITEFFFVKLQKKLNLTSDSENFIGNFRLKFYKKILKKNIEFHDFNRLAKIQDVYNNDFDGLYSFTPFNLLAKLRDLLKTVFSFIVLVNISYELFLIQLANNLCRMYMEKKQNEVSWDEFSNISSKRSEILTESLQNIKYVKCFSIEDKLYKIYKNFSKEMVAISRRCRDLWSNSPLLNYFSLALNVYSGKMVIQGTLALGDFYTFRLVATQLNYSSENLFRFYQNTTKNYFKIKNIFELMDYKRDEKKESVLGSVSKIFDKENNNNNNENSNKEISFEGEVEFRNVNFHYPTRPKAQILNELSFKINKGDVVAFCGASGSGKSTIACLFHRLYDPENGEVLIDNKNLKLIDLDLFHTKIGYVSQDAFLFSLSIRENMLLGLKNSNLSAEENEKLEEKLNITIKRANCEFVYDKSIFPDGLNTIVSGNNLSGGQKQRIAIARALMKEVNFLVFDEATSALDANSEAEVQKAIDEIIKEARITTIIIAHRLSTIKNCHKIFVLNKGRVVEEGTHKELKKLNGFYKELINKQIEAFEKEEQETLLRKKTSKLL